MPRKASKIALSQLEIIEIACRKPEEVTHWSKRELARKAGVPGLS